MSEKNGNGWIIKTLVGVLFTIAYGAITTLTANVIANDKDSRARDMDQVENLRLCVAEQQRTNQEIKVALAQILVELKYLGKDEFIAKQK